MTILFRSLVIIMFFFFSAFSFSQDYQRTIQWQNNKNIPPEDVSKGISQYLSFKLAAYENYKTLLPYYTETIELNSSGVKATLTNLQFEKIEQKQLSNVGHLDSLTGTIQLQQNVYMQRKKPYLLISFIPLRKGPDGSIERLVSFTIHLRPIDKSGISSSRLKHLKSSVYASQSVLNSGTWIKIKIPKTGIYKLTHAQLTDMGISDPSNVSIFGRGGGVLPFYNNEPVKVNLKEIPVHFEDKNNNGFGDGDYILFYGKGPTKWQYDDINKIFKHEKHYYANASYYFITSSQGKGKEPAFEPSTTDTPNTTITTFNDFAYHEKDEENLVKSGREFYEKIDFYPSYQYSFSFPNILQNKPVHLSAKVASRSTQQSQFQVNANSSPVTTLITNGFGSLTGYTYAQSAFDTSSFYTNQSNISVSISFNNPDPSGLGWLDYILLNAGRKLKMNGNQMSFRSIASIASGNVSAFKLSNANNNILVWDVTDQHDIKNIGTSMNGDTLEFTLHTDTLREFIAFDKTKDVFTPVYKDDEKAGPVQNQNLHGIGQPDMIIVTLDQYKQEAEDLADFHREADQLDVVVVRQNELFNEFSSGAPDVSALRNFMRMLYDRADNEDELPQYLLLFGDGSYKNKGNTDDFILTYQNKNSLNEVNSIVTDDYYGLLDSNEGEITGLLDIGIGRFPVNSQTEARMIVDKIKNYYSNQNMGSWRKKICFFSDDQNGDHHEGNQHMDGANSLARYIENHYPAFDITKVYLDAFRQVSTSTGDRYPEAKQLVNDIVNSGVLIFNYTGHGGEMGLTHEQVLTINDVLSWNNQDKLALFVTASCEVSRFDDSEHVSFGEHILLNDQGGGVALFSTTRLVYANENDLLNEQFFKYVLEHGPGNEKYTLGDIARLAKTNIGSSNTENKRKFTLLGDPALKLVFPERNVATTKVNNVNISQYTDTISALEKVTIEGRVEDTSGNFISDFNGIVYPVVFDKKTNITTLRNDGGNHAFNFSTRDNILFKGKASVTNGAFSFQFIVPKDISYNYGYGKISYYADNNDYDLRGSYDSIIIGGSYNNAQPDTTGPSIDLYLNDKSFVSGSVTDENPVLLAYVSDSNGINTVSQGIGHGISAVLEGSNTLNIDLNSYYESDIDDYQSGKIEYPFNNLNPGTYTLTVKIWDVYNNSAQKSIEFTVQKSSKLKLDHVLNYPNPFTTRTSFYFEHNQPNQTMDVLIQIFTVSGKLVKTIKTTTSPEGYRAGPIEWDGLDDFGDKIGRGVYVYRLNVRCNNKTAEKIEKLVILR